MKHVTMKDYKLSTDRAAADIAKRSRYKTEFMNASVRVDEEQQKVIIEIDLSSLAKEELQKSKNGNWRILADSNGAYRLRVDGFQHVMVKFAAFIAEEEYQPPNVKTYTEPVKNSYDDPKALAHAVKNNPEALQELLQMLQSQAPAAQVEAPQPKRRGRPKKQQVE